MSEFKVKEFKGVAVPFWSGITAVQFAYRFHVNGSVTRYANMPTDIDGLADARCIDVYMYTMGISTTVEMVVHNGTKDIKTSCSFPHRPTDYTAFSNIPGDTYPEFINNLVLLIRRSIPTRYLSHVRLLQNCNNAGIVILHTLVKSKTMREAGQLENLIMDFDNINAFIMSMGYYKFYSSMDYLRFDAEDFISEEFYLSKISVEPLKSDKPWAATDFGATNFSDPKCTIYKRGITCLGEVVGIGDVIKKDTIVVAILDMAENKLHFNIISPNIYIGLPVPQRVAILTLKAKEPFTEDVRKAFKKIDSMKKFISTLTLISESCCGPKKKSKEAINLLTSLKKSKQVWAFYRNHPSEEGVRNISSILMNTINPKKWKIRVIPRISTLITDITTVDRGFSVTHNQELNTDNMPIFNGIEDFMYPLGRFSHDTSASITESGRDILRTAAKDFEKVMAGDSGDISKEATESV